MKEKRNPYINHITYKCKRRILEEHHVSVPKTPQLHMNHIIACGCHTTTDLQYLLFLNHCYKDHCAKICEKQRAYVDIATKHLGCTRKDIVLVVKYMGDYPYRGPCFSKDGLNEYKNRLTVVKRSILTKKQNNPIDDDNREISRDTDWVFVGFVGGLLVIAIVLKLILSSDLIDLREL